MAARGRGKSRRGPGRPPLTQTQRVINAVQRGAQDARAIAKSARVPILHVHPILSRLRREGRVEGFTGTLRVVERPADEASGPKTGAD